MDTLVHFFNVMLHIDQELKNLIGQYGSYIYGVLAAVVFGETGLVVLPFLPGDSLLFISGAFAADGLLNVWVLTFTLILAAILGNTLNYAIGHKIGERVYEKESRWISHDALVKTHNFYEKHGGKALVLARFLPIVRTFAPFVAGVSEMSFVKFQKYNVIGAVAWVIVFVWGGYVFGHIEFIRNHLSTIAIVGFLMALIPASVGFLWNMLRRRNNKGKK